MSREFIKIHFPEEQLKSARATTHREAEGFGDTSADSFKSIAAKLLDEVFESDRGLQTPSTYEGDFRSQPGTFYSNNTGVHFCDPTPFPARIIDAAKESLKSDYGGLHGNVVIDTQDSVKTDEATMNEIKNLHSLPQGAESVVFVNWNEKDASHEAQGRREIIAKELSATAVTSAVHIVVVPSNQPVQISQEQEQVPEAAAV